MKLSWTGIGTITAALIGILTLGGYAMPYLQSDPAPLAGTVRVQSLNTQVAATLTGIQQAIAKLQAHQDRVDAQQHQIQLDMNGEKRKATLRDMLQVQADLAHHPGDPVLKAALAQDQQDLADLAQEHSMLLKQR